jgi:NADH-quinone oxidoreductase subunit N
MHLNEAFPLQFLGFNEIWSLFPLFALSFGALLSVIVGTHKKNGHGYAFSLSFVFLVVAMIQATSNLFAPDINLLGGSLTFDSYTKTVSLMVMSFALIATVLTYGHDKKEGLLSEVYGLILFATAGMVLMLSTSHLIFLFISLEIMSLAVYVLVAMRRSSRFSSEAGLKYFVLGGLASAMLLYGSSLIYGSTGSFELTAIQTFLAANPNPSYIFLIGLGLVSVSMLFKVGAVPFHGWLPDVYQGASTNITGFMGAAVKFTAFLAFAKIVKHIAMVPGVSSLTWFHSMIWVVCAASMIYGNFVAISQNEIKRMLSFSTIAHTGYLLLGLMVMNQGEGSFQSLILYLFFYALANLGVFAIIAMFEERNQKDLSFDQIAGLGNKHPVLGIMFTIFLLSMAGIPLTSGFIGKYGLFSNAVNAGQIPLVVIAVLTSVVSVYYYLRVIVFLFMKEATDSQAVYHRLTGASLAAFLSAAATLQFGVFPRAIISFVKMISR